jgi:hypothetical protein
MSLLATPGSIRVQLQPPGTTTPAIPATPVIPATKPAVPAKKP